MIIIIITTVFMRLTTFQLIGLSFPEIPLYGNFNTQVLFRCKCVTSYCDWLTTTTMHYLFAKMVHYKLNHSLTVIFLTNLITGVTQTSA